MARLPESKILSRPALREAVRKAKAAGNKVVFTNGCFDILHVGHVRYLQSARSLGSLLVVGVNTDETVRKLKGPNRPVTCESERMEILAALECVDYVTLFAEDTPAELILAIKPDVHVKGGDYSPEDLPEAEAARSVGARVQTIPYASTQTEGISTTNTITRILRDGS